MKALDVNDRKAEDSCDRGRHALESGPGGIRHLADGKPYYTGREN